MKEILDVIAMNCHNCGEKYLAATTDIPFKTGTHSVVINKDLPVLQCANCGEYLIEDSEMRRADEILSSIEKDVEVGIIRYAA